jgi:type I restriction enzyme S subunit
VVAVRSFGRGTFHKPALQGDELTWQKLFQVRANDLLVSNIKAWEGAVALALPEDDGRYCSHRYLTCVADRSRAVPAFLGYYFKTPKGVRSLSEASPGSADRNRTLSMDRLRTIRVPLPPLAEQQRIVGRIEELRDKVAEAKRLREAAAREVGQTLMGMSQRADLSDDERRKLGWRILALSECLTPAGDRHAVRPDEVYPNLGIYSFGRGLFMKPPIEGSATSAGALWRVRAGQFIYSRLFAFEGAYGVVPADLDGHFVSNEFPMFDCDQSVIRPEFLSAYFSVPTVWARVASGSKGLGNRRQRVKPAQLLTHRLWIPPLAWQEKIAEVDATAAALRRLQSQTAAELDALMPSILDRAFRGEL